MGQENAIDHLCDYTHIRVGGRSATQTQEMSPLPHVGRHNNLGLEGIGEDRTSFLRTLAESEKVKVGFLRTVTGIFPNIPARVTLRTPRGFDDSDFTAETVLGVIAVPGRFLTVSCQSVTDNFMAHATVTGDTERDASMFDDRFMTSLQEVADKLLSTVGSDLVFRFVTGASGLFYQRERRLR